MRRLILHSHLSPGDIVMLTAAVRDLKKALGAAGDVRTPCPALWENNPHLTPLADGEEIECHYALFPRQMTVHSSMRRNNFAPCRF